MSIINTYNSSTNFKRGEFHHAVLSISGTVHTLFLDGIQVAQNTNAGDIFSTYSTITNTTIGCLTDASQAFRGFIGDFKVYNKAINATAVSNLYLNRNLVIYYPFDVSVNNYTPNNALLAYDASFVGNATTTTNSLIGTNALSLTNTVGTKAMCYVNSSPVNSIPLNSSTGLTISCWVNTLGLTNTSTMCLFDIPSATGRKGISIDICGNNYIYSTGFAPPPSVPSGLTIVSGPTYNSINISFTMSVVTASLTYSVLITPTTATTVSGTNTNLTIGGLSPNTTYSNLYVVAYNGGGNDPSISTSTLSFTTTKIPVTYTYTGATKTTYGNYTILTYTTVGTGNVNITNTSPKIGCVVVGGGGGASWTSANPPNYPYQSGAGGGVYNTGYSGSPITFTQGTTYNITVGNGGYGNDTATGGAYNSTSSSIINSSTSINAVICTGGKNGFTGGKYGYQPGGAIYTASTGGSYSLNNGGSYTKNGGDGSTLKWTNPSGVIVSTGGINVVLSDINLNKTYGDGGNYGGVNGTSAAANTGIGGGGNFNYSAAGNNTSVYGGSGIVIIYFPTYIG